MTREIRVLIGDDDTSTRAGIRHALEGRGFEVVAEEASAANAIDAAVRESPDLCVIDIHLPGGGIQTARELAARLPATSVVMLTVEHDDEDLFESLLAGAAGYLPKDMEPDRLPDALRGAVAGEAAVPRSLVARVLEEFRAREGRKRRFLVGTRRVQLSSREWEVLHHLRNGQTTAEIARRLFVEPVTIRSHIAAILKKLDVKDRAAAIALFEEADRD